MARINLLPWRQEARERKNREFITLVASVLLLSLLAAGAAWSYFNNELDGQKQANEKIKDENTKLDKQLTEIDSLEKQRDEMLSRMKVIQDLQGRRPIPVRVWSDVAKAIPAQMYLINMKREGDVLTFRGKADNANVVADFMRNLDASPWLKNSALKSISQPQATPYAPVVTPSSTTSSTASPNTPARPVYPEDSYVEFVVTSTVAQSSNIAGASSSTPLTTVVTTTSSTSTTVMATSSTASVSAVANSNVASATPVAKPVPTVPASATTVTPPANTTPTHNTPVSPTSISNAPISNAPVGSSTTITTTKERSNG